MVIRMNLRYNVEAGAQAPCGLFFARIYIGPVTLQKSA